jgi:hypothetical protein
MKRMTTKMSTVTPVTKSTGSGVANMGKKSKGLSMYQNKTKSPSILSSAEAAKEMSGTKSKMPRIGMERTSEPMKKIGMTTKVERKNAGMPSIGMEYTSMPMPKKQRMTTSKTTTKQKAKAKMLPTVTVTAPKAQKRFAVKITSRKKG